MTDDNRFFRFLWRFNAAAIALAAVLLILVFAWNLMMPLIWHAPVESPPQGHFAPVPKTAEREYTYRLQGSPLPSHIGDEQFLTLKRWRGEPNVYGLEDIRTPLFASPPSVSSSNDEERDVNLLAIDARTASSRLLFHGYQRAILTTDAVTAAKTSNAVAAPVPPAIAMVIQVISADTNHDGVLDGHDRQSLYVYDGKGGDAVKLLDADFILAMGGLDDGRYLIVSEQGSVATAAIYSVPGFKLVSKAVLPNVPL
jgi:hypothetical protein